MGVCMVKPFSIGCERFAADPGGKLAAIEIRTGSLSPKVCVNFSRAAGNFAAELNGNLNLACRIREIGSF